MQPNITKLCADSLRTYARERCSFNLGSAHAHELISAFVGYQSRASLLADTQSPINNLLQADYIVFPPYNDAVSAIFSERRKKLGIIRLDEYDVSHVVSEILNQQHGIIAFGQRLEGIAVDISRSRLKERFRTLGIDLDQINLNTQVISSDIRSSEISFTISNDYVSDAGVTTQRDSTMIVTFPRIAGYVGYKEPHVEETRYAGEARQIVEQAKSLPQWPYPAGTLVMARDWREIGIVLQAEDGGAYGGSVTICTHTSLSAGLVKGEVFPLADQSTEFVPMRLFMPYGKYICEDGSEVLFNRDYNPLWARKPDGSVIALEPDTWVFHRDAVHYYDGERDSSEQIHAKGMLILREWGVENKHPLILGLLPQAIKAGSAEVLKAKYGGDRTKVFPPRS